MSRRGYNEANSADDGFTQLPNELLEALYQTDNRLSPMHYRVLLYLIRMTHGWHRARDRISIQRMAFEIGKDRRNVSRAVNDLEKMGILEIDRPGRGRIADINIKRPGEWDCSPIV
jgi:phage replication O-like protein O